ncbi:hypothetical protein H1C71_024170 [Ictidomys tridecemlineatus]|nr:hypothetical protein H1C71_024170 [Ictidomys tridecemlineatus]
MSCPPGRRVLDLSWRWFAFSVTTHSTSLLADRQEPSQPHVRPQDWEAGSHALHLVITKTVSRHGKIILSWEQSKYSMTPLLHTTLPSSETLCFSTVVHSSLLSKSWQPLAYFTSYSLPFPEGHMKGTTQYAALQVWCVSLSKMHL